MAMNVVRRNVVNGTEKVVNIVESKDAAAEWVKTLPGKVFAEPEYWLVDGDYIYLVEKTA